MKLKNSKVFLALLLLALAVLGTCSAFAANIGSQPMYIVISRLRSD